MGCLAFLPVGEQAEQPLQLCGAGLQVRGELGPGLCPAAVQRVKQLALTARGRQLVERVLPAHAARVDAAMKALTPAEQADLHRLLRRLEVHLDEMDAGGGPATEG